MEIRVLLTKLLVAGEDLCVLTLILNVGPIEEAVKMQCSLRKLVEFWEAFNVK